MEKIVVVNEKDHFIREEERETCHDGDGILHRGFLVTLFNMTGELWLAQRSEQKRLWPGTWDGTVASHVIKGENYVQAAKRRLKQGVSISSGTLEYLFKFQYKARYKDIGTEHEICAVMRIKGLNIDDFAPDI
jgi:isopentenyl-diphosphate delta-isomerase